MIIQRRAQNHLFLRRSSSHDPDRFRRGYPGLGSRSSLRRARGGFQPLAHLLAPLMYSSSCSRTAARCEAVASLLTSRFFRAPLRRSSPGSHRTGSSTRRPRLVELDATVRSVEHFPSEDLDQFNSLCTRPQTSSFLLRSSRTRTFSRSSQDLRPRLHSGPTTPVQDSTFTGSKDSPLRRRVRAGF